MRRRGVSTVVDATLALLLISASVLVVMLFLADDKPEMESQASEHVSETVVVSTANVSYSLSAIEDDIDSEVVDFGEYDHAVFQRHRHGSVADLIASSTMLNVTIGGRQLTEEGGVYSNAVEGALLDTLTGVGYDAYVTARWRPYENASIVATETYGSPPPGDADVQLVTLRVPSGVEPVAASAEEAYEHGYGLDDKYERAGATLAGAIVDRYYPAAEMQVALEGQWFRRDLAVYRYLRMKEILNEVDDGDSLGGDSDDVYYHLDPGDDGNMLGRNGANATKAGAYLAVGSDAAPNISGGADGLQTVIAADLAASFADEEMESFAEASSIEDVRITIRVWDQ